MAETTHISWADATFNPWEGCARVSPGCLHCYAETRAKRFGNGDLWRGQRRRTSDAYWKQPARWDRQAAATGVRRRVFCASLADVFDDHPAVRPWRYDLWRVIEATPNLDWLLLTKRPENVREMVPLSWIWRGVDGPPPRWPANAWIGTTVEDQTRADERLPYLLEIPAPVRFVSAEPLLGPLDLLPWLGAIDWIIVGGESGPDARPLPVDAVVALHRDVVRHNAARFEHGPQVSWWFKQTGATLARDLGLVSRSGSDLREIHTANIEVARQMGAYQFLPVPRSAR